MITGLKTDMNDLAILLLELKSISVMTVIHSIVEKFFLLIDTVLNFISVPRRDSSSHNDLSAEHMVSVIIINRSNST